MAGKTPLVAKRQVHQLSSTSTIMKSDHSFQLSRIYAKGWNMAKALSSDRLDGLDEQGIAAMNPYRIEDERRRWQQGFAAGALR